MANLEDVCFLPDFKVILKAVLKNQMQSLIDQLALHTDEEFILMSANVSDKTLHHIGSKSGISFLNQNDDIMLKFLDYCDKSHQSRIESGEIKQTDTSNTETTMSGARAKSWKLWLQEQLDKQPNQAGLKTQTPLRNPSKRGPYKGKLKKGHSTGKKSNRSLSPKPDYENRDERIQKRLFLPKPGYESREDRKQKDAPYPVALVRKKTKTVTKGNNSKEPEANSTSKSEVPVAELDTDSENQGFDLNFQIKTEPIDFDEEGYNLERQEIALDANAGTLNTSSLLDDHAQEQIQQSADQNIEQYTQHHGSEEANEHNNGAGEISIDDLNMSVDTIPEAEIKLEMPDAESDQFETSLQNIEPSTSYGDSPDLGVGQEREKTDKKSGSDTDDEYFKINMVPSNTPTKMKKAGDHPCIYCNFKCDDYGQLLQHKIDQHGTEINWMQHENQMTSFGVDISEADINDPKNQVDNTVCVLNCPHKSCRETFNEIRAYIEHVDEHMGLFTCFKCNKKVRGKPNMNTHVRICTGLTSYRCELCHRDYNNITALKRHTLAMHLSKRYTCSCGIEYKYKTSLVKHQRKHQH